MPINDIPVLAMSFAGFAKCLLIINYLQACAKNVVLVQMQPLYKAKNATTVTCSDIFGDCCALKFSKCRFSLYFTILNRR